MPNSLLTNIGIFVKRITGISDISLARKKLHKQLGKQIYHKKYNALELVKLMQEMGMKKGSVVCIHCAMREFYNYEGTATELIDAILNAIGEEGTLVMPAFPAIDIVNKENYIFNAKTDKTGAGYLAETFRKYPGVKRSINIQHSVCAIGPLADYLIKDHHHCQNCWDENSPWYRMCEKDALIFNFGMPRSYMGTFHHCVESLLRNEHPYYKQFFNCPKINKYYDENGNVKEYRSLESYIERRTRKTKVTRHFKSDDWQIRKISNLEVKVFYSKHALTKMLDLGRKGITVYYVPNPKKYDF